MHKSYQNGDVIIKRAELTNGSSRVSILGQLAAIDIFEDMAKPTLYATLQMYDAIDLLGKFPIVGEETLVLDLETPGLLDSVTYKFRVYEISNVQHADNRVALGYTLKCTSEEHLQNGSVEVHQSFVGTLSDMVVSVSTNYLRSRKKMIVEATKGVQTVVCPKWSPLVAIDFARRNAVSVRYPSSSYVFFENQDGFVFKTVEALMDEGRLQIGSRVFSFVQNPSAVAQSVNYRSVLEYEHIQRPDAVSSGIEGTFFTETEMFDLKTKTLSKQQFQIANKFQNFATPDDGGAQMPYSAEFIRQVSAGDPTRLYMIRDGNRPYDYVPDAAAARNSFTQLLNGNITRLLVHGDIGLKAGAVIRLKLPEIVGTTGPRKEDPMYSGNYIVLRLRHIITSGPKHRHQVALDCAKVGVRA